MFSWFFEFTISFYYCSLNILTKPGFSFPTRNYCLYCSIAVDEKHSNIIERLYFNIRQIILFYIRKLCSEIMQHSAMISFIVEKANALLSQAWLIAANFIWRGDGSRVVISYSNWITSLLRNMALLHIIWSIRVGDLSLIRAASASTSQLGCLAWVDRCSYQPLIIRNQYFWSSHSETYQGPQWISLYSWIVDYKLSP